MKKKVNALVPAAAVLVILCAAYGLITWHQHRKADELAGPAEGSRCRPSQRLRRPVLGACGVL